MGSFKRRPKMVNRDAEYSERSATWPNEGDWHVHEAFGGHLGSAISKCGGSTDLSRGV